MTASSRRLVITALLMVCGSGMYAGATIAQVEHTDYKCDTCANVGIGFLVVGSMLTVVEYGVTLREKPRNETPLD